MILRDRGNQNLGLAIQWFSRTSRISNRTVVFRGPSKLSQVIASH